MDLNEFECKIKLLLANSSLKLKIELSELIKQGIKESLHDLEEVVTTRITSNIKSTISTDVKDRRSLWISIVSLCIAVGMTCINLGFIVFKILG